MDPIEWIDIVRTAYEEFDVFPKGTVAQLEAENQRLRHVIKEGLEWTDENIEAYLAPFDALKEGG